MTRIPWLPLLAVAALLSSAAPAEDYPVSVQPGLVAHFGPSQVVPPRLPFHTGMGRVGAEIEAIERVALVTADQLPSLDPSLGAGPAGQPVWAVFFRGRLTMDLPGSAIEQRPATRGFYLVDDRSGVWYSIGALGEPGGMASRPDH
jgi:hypothetical protein